MKRAVGVSLVAGLMVCLCGSALRADSLTATGWVAKWAGQDPEIVHIALTSPTDSSKLLVNENVYAGYFNWKVESGDYTPLLGRTFQAYCIEVLQNAVSEETWTVTSLANAPVPGNPPSTDEGSGMGSEKAKALRALFALDFATSLTDRMESAAMQVAIWEIVYDDRGTTDGKWNVLEGNFRASNNSMVTTRAQALLNELSDPQSSWGSANVIALAAGSDTLSIQDMATVVVPVPTAGLSTLALLGLLAGARFYRTRHRAA